MSALLFSSKNHARYAVRIAVTAFIKNVTTTGAPALSSPVTASGPIRALRGTVSDLRWTVTSTMMVPWMLMYWTDTITPSRFPEKTYILYSV